MTITSLDNKNIKNIVKLKNKKYRDKENKFVVDIINVIKEAHKNNLLLELYVKENTYCDIDFPCIYLSDNVFNKIKNVETTNVIAVIKKPTQGRLIGNKYILLDNIQDPGNLGTIIRSSLAFNIDTLVLGSSSVDLYNDKVIRATEGAIFKLNIVKMDLCDCINILKDKNITIYGTDVNNGINIEEVKKDSFAIILGNEGKGISKEVNILTDKNVYININKDIESLNVAVAASIIMYELNK